MKATLVSLCLAFPLCAQSIQSIDPSAAARPVEPTPEPLDRDAAADLIAVPSRYAGEKLEAYLNALVSSLAMRNRERDPFGRHQDPDYEPPKPVIANKAIEKYKPAPVTPFSDIVDAIPITAIIPAQRKFLVGGKAFSVGSRIKLNTGSTEPVTVHVIDIGNDRVVFRNGATRETAPHVLGAVPDGMSHGIKPIAPEGMVPGPANDTIDINPPNNLSSRR
jgi:hypothetical protein